MTEFSSYLLLIKRTIKQLKCWCPNLIPVLVPKRDPTSIVTLSLRVPCRCLQAAIVTSAQFCQTCLLCSQSQRHESMYSPVGKFCGTTTRSTMLTFIMGFASCDPGVQPGVGLSPRPLPRGAGSPREEARRASGGLRTTRRQISS